MAATRIDCDIHPAVGGTRTTLLPYLSDHWKEQVVSRAIDGLVLTSYPPSIPLSGADAGAGSGDRGDRAPRRRQPLRLHPGAGAGRDAAGPAAFLAGLSARGEKPTGPP